ncbi:MAG: hypothetical protein RI897_2198 [Verrucomicrobiota bacterium]
MIDDGAVLFGPVAEVSERRGLGIAVWGAAVSECDVVVGLEVDFPGDGGVAGALVGENGLALDSKGAGEERLAAPKGDIDGVDAPSGDEAQGVVVSEPPGFAVLGTFHCGVGGLGGGAEPGVIIDGWGRLGWFCGAAGLAGTAPDVDVFECSDFSAANELASLPELASGPLLGSKLEYAAVGLEGFAEELIFLDGEPEGLFDVHILAGLGGGEGDWYVPVVGGSDEYAVDVPAFEQLGEVRAGLGVVVLVGLVDLAFGAGERVLFDVADGEHFAIGLGEEVAHDASSLWAGADTSDPDAVVGAGEALAAEGLGGEDEGECCGGERESARACEEGTAG